MKQVYVNRRPTQSWSVALPALPSWDAFGALVDGARRDFVGKPQTALFILPPNGWVAVIP